MNRLPIAAVAASLMSMVASAHASGGTAQLFDVGLISSTPQGFALVNDSGSADVYTPGGASYSHMSASGNFALDASKPGDSLDDAKVAFPAPTGQGADLHASAVTTAAGPAIISTSTFTSTFTLAPNTGIDASALAGVSFDYMVAGETTVDNFAIATISLTAIGDSQKLSSSDSVFANNVSRPVDPEDEVVSASLFNYSNITYTGTLTETVEVYSSPASAVPEPASVALLLAGLGCIGFVARRR